MHVINIKSYLLQTEDLYCTSLTHIHKNTIYTERLGGAGALRGGVEEPPAPPRPGGAVPTARRAQEVSASRRASYEAHVSGVVPPPCPPRQHLEEGDEDGEERAEHEQLPREATKRSRFSDAGSEARP